MSLLIKQSQSNQIDIQKKKKKLEKILLRDLDQVEKIGEGTFGQVYRGEYFNPKTNKIEMIAIKKFKYLDKGQLGISITTLREMQFLQQLDHPNIVNLREIIHSRPSDSLSNKKMGSTYLIFDFLNNDLQGMMNNPTIKFKLGNIK